MDGPQDEGIEMNAELAGWPKQSQNPGHYRGCGRSCQPREDTCLCHSLQEEDRSEAVVRCRPLPLDIGVGYDHISGYVGGSLAAGAGADYLCYITPSEHLAHLNAAQVREGVVAFNIAAHIGDTLKYGPQPEDKNLACYRRARDWDGQFIAAIDGDRAREIHHQDKAETCSMCGKYCAILIMESYLK